MTDQTRPDDQRDPGARISHEPELEGESIPGGVGPHDERTSADASRPGVKGEPDATDVVDGPVGDASLVDPSDNPDGGADLDALPPLPELEQRSRGAEDRSKTTV